MTVLERYLTRLGITRPRLSAVPLLDVLLAHHVDAIAFENLDPLLGRPVSIGPADIAAKLLEGGRGGYCHEHARLSQQVLAELGFHCVPLLARVYSDPELRAPGGLTHHATLVEVDGGWRLFDPGYGGGTPTLTLPVEIGARVGDFRIVAADEVLMVCQRAADVSLMLQRRSGTGRWYNLYGFDPVPAVAADVAVSNWYVSTSPDSKFTRSLMLARPLLDGSRHSFTAGTLRTVTPGGGEHRVAVRTREQFAGMLRENFRISLDAESVAAAWKVIGE